MTAEEWKKVDEALKNHDFKMLLQFISTMNFVASGLWRTARNAGDFVVVKNSRWLPKRIVNFTELVARKLSRSLKTSLAIMCIYHIGQTLRK